MGLRIVFNFYDVGYKGWMIIILRFVKFMFGVMVYVLSILDLLLFLFLMSVVFKL